MRPVIPMKNNRIDTEIQRLTERFAHSAAGQNVAVVIAAALNMVSGAVRYIPDPGAAKMCAKQLREIADALEVTAQKETH